MKRSLHSAGLFLLIVCTVLPISFAWPTGAPDGACPDYNPSGHGASEVGDEPPPYTVTVTKVSDGSVPKNYTTTDALKVTVTPNADIAFKGILIRARRADKTLDQNEAIGTFTIPANFQEHCNGSYGNGVTHTEASNKTGLELIWTPPSAMQGHIEFRLTVVQTKLRYWTFNANPGTVSDPNAPDIANVQVTDDNSELKLTDCSTDPDMGCFSRPSGCTVDCDAAVTWKIEGSKIRFQMTSKDDYVALGFSADKKMGDDEVIDCVHDTSTGNVTAGNSRNNGYSNSKDGRYSAGISEQANGVFDNKAVVCRFLHDGIEGGFKVGATKKYFLLLASGTTNKDSKNKHSTVPLISDNEVMVEDGEFIGGSLSKPWLVKIHGVVMMIAWVAFASIAILLARYYKDVWPNSTLLSQKVWFTIHRFLMVSVLLLTIAGIVVIFVHVEGWSEITTDTKILKAHPFLGIIVAALAIINPIMALFRPHPGDANRVYFNWAHWGVGTTAHVVSIFAVFLGLSLPSAEGIAPDYLIWIMVTFVVVYVVTDITLEVHKCTIKTNKGSNSMEMQQMGQGGKSDSSDGFTFRQMLLAVYVLVVIGLTAALAIVVLVQ